MRGRSCTQPFLVEVEKGGCRLSPQRSVSSAPLGKSIAPSSVTFGDSFPPRGSLRRCYTPATKCFLAHPLLPQNANPNQGTQMGIETAPPSEQCATTAKTSEWERAGYKTGGPGGLPLALFLPISREKWGPPPGRRGPRGAAPRGTGKAPTTRRVRSTLPHPRPGPGGETTSQGWTCDGPRPDHLPLPPQLFQHSCSTSARTRQAWSQFSWAWSQKSCRRQGSSVASAPAR